MLSLGLIILTLLLENSYARIQHTPEDTYAFPKYRVNFLNNHPVSSDNAQAWLSEGLKNGVQEFMGSYRSVYENDWPRLDGNEGDEPTKAVLEPKLKKMKLGPKRSFVCLVPPALDVAPREYEEPAPVDPAKSWQLLQPLTGHCIYHRQGWFTYAYCHNSHVRQFRELEHTHPHPAGGRIPEEDPEYQGYTLGKSPTSLRTRETAADIAVPDTARGATNDLQLNEGAGQRYLTSKWTDGTLCDKTLLKRQVEVQFHCSMTTTDQIQFLKETSVCQYLLVIHTPRLCGEPGFQSAREKQPAAPIHCREILAPEAMSSALDVQSVLPEAPFPSNSFTRNPIHLPNPHNQQLKKARAKTAGLDRPALGSGKFQQGDALHKVLQKLLGSNVKIPGDHDGHGHGEELGQNVFDEFELGTPIRGEDGEELYVQVLDLEGREGEDQEDLMARVKAALAGRSFSPRKSDQEDEEEEILLYDDPL